ncbi:MAG: DUF4292 domain-containing protein [Prolixibacteraceae bacterium]
MNVGLNTKIKQSFFGIICLVLLGFSSCKTSRVATRTTVAKPITTSKLIRNVESNAFDYKHFSIKKISCQFDNGKTKTSFRASIIAEKDKQITVMLSKLNIPVGRVWLTPDSVKFINYLEKTYFLDNYSYLSSLMEMDLDFETIHAIISSNVFALRDQKKDKDLKDFDTKIDSGLYVMQSVRKLKSKQKILKPGDRRYVKRAQKILPDTPVNQSVYIDPETFKVRKIVMTDPANSRNLKIGFDDFTAIEKQLYPADISFQFSSPENNMEMNIKMSGFSMDNEKEIRFRVPDKYTRINHD